MKKSQPIKQRIVWGFDPVTRVVPSKKRYHRQEQKAVLRKVYEAKITKNPKSRDFTQNNQNPKKFLHLPLLFNHSEV